MEKEQNKASLTIVTIQRHERSSKPDKTSLQYLIDTNLFKHLSVWSGRKIKTIVLDFNRILTLAFPRLFVQKGNSFAKMFRNAIGVHFLFLAVEAGLRNNAETGCLYEKWHLYIFKRKKMTTFMCLTWETDTSLLQCDLNQWGCWLRSAIQRLASSKMCWPTAIMILNKMAVRLTANWSLFLPVTKTGWLEQTRICYQLCFLCALETPSWNFISIPPQKLCFTPISRMLIFINTHKNETYSTLSHPCQGFIHSLNSTHTVCLIGEDNKYCENTYRLVRYWNDDINHGGPHVLEALRSTMMMLCQSQRGLNKHDEPWACDFTETLAK